jgi:glycosyltransferase involved in cell wall biosynthesis
MSDDCAIIIAPHFDKGGSNNIFAAQIAYYESKNWISLLLLASEFKDRRSLDSTITTELKAGKIADIYISRRRRHLRYTISRHVLGNERNGPLHRHFINKIGTVDQETKKFLEGKHIRELCVNWFDNIDCALNIRTELQASDAPITVFTHDIMAHHKYTRRKKPIDISDIEDSNLRKADKLVHLSEVDATYFLKRISKSQKTSYATLNPETEVRLQSLRRKARPRTVLYVGSWNYSNPSGAEWFVRQVMPFSKKDITFFFAGSICNFLERHLWNETHVPNVHLLHRVDDVIELYENVQAVVLPSIDGTGASVKLVEALAMGVPFVASPASLRGIPSALKDVLAPYTASRPIEFADKLEAVLDGRIIGHELRTLYWEYFGNKVWGSRLDASDGVS